MNKKEWIFYSVHTNFFNEFFIKFIELFSRAGKSLKIARSHALDSKFLNDNIFKKGILNANYS